VAGRRLLLAEVNAAIEGAVAGGATEIVVNDSHSTMRNLPAPLSVYRSFCAVIMLTRTVAEMV
jgi:D-aminopeptidase